MINVMSFVLLFTAFLKHSHGQYSKKHVERVSHMVGSFGKEIQKIYTNEVAGTYSSIKETGTLPYEEDIPDFVAGQKFIESFY